jgi:hypothetical protein
MQITSLVHALGEFFKTNVTSSNALMFYEICSQLDYQQGSQMCKKVCNAHNLFKQNINFRPTLVDYNNSMEKLFYSTNASDEQYNSKTCLL